MTTITLYASHSTGLRCHINIVPMVFGLRRIEFFIADVPGLGPDLADIFAHAWMRWLERVSMFRCPSEYDPPKGWRWVTDEDELFEWYSDARMDSGFNYGPP